MTRSALNMQFEALGLDHWREPVGQLVEKRLSPSAHGDMARWQAALSALPPLDIDAINLDCDTVTVSGSTAAADELADALMQLKPWRKGPFDIGGVFIDTEWRSDWKWQRVASQLSPLDDRAVLDVGCGNGYYAFRMLGAGARCVIGVDPTLLFVMQFEAINRYVERDDVHILPARLEELPDGTQAFDTVFSMGVLYHQRSPVDHLRDLKKHLKPGGELVLETLVLPGDSAMAATPPERYARMRNVWLLPTISELETWLARSGFIDTRVADVNQTSTDEQRPTAWMDFESLEQALDPGDPDLTVEGWPAPRRAVVIARVR